jgi:hypothetical protein
MDAQDMNESAGGGVIGNHYEYGIRPGSKVISISH